MYMCRSIKVLRRPAEPATKEEMSAAALQFVRKVSGTRKPSGKNTQVFEDAVARIFAATRQLVDSLETNAPPKNRELEAEKARARATERYG